MDEDEPSFLEAVDYSAESDDEDTEVDLGAAAAASVTTDTGEVPGLLSDSENNRDAWKSEPVTSSQWLFKTNKYLFIYLFKRLYLFFFFFRAVSIPKILKVTTLTFSILFLLSMYLCLEGWIYTANLTVLPLLEYKHARKQVWT